MSWNITQDALRMQLKYESSDHSDHILWAVWTQMCPASTQHVYWCIYCHCHNIECHKLISCYLFIYFLLFQMEQIALYSCSLIHSTICCTAEQGGSNKSQVGVTQETLHLSQFLSRQLRALFMSVTFPHCHIHTLLEYLSETILGLINCLACWLGESGDQTTDLPLCGWPLYRLSHSCPMWWCIHTSGCLMELSTGYWITQDRFIWHISQIVIWCVVYERILICAVWSLLIIKARIYI